MHLEISKFTIYIVTSFSYNPSYLLLANLRNFRTTIHKYTEYLPISLISFLNNSPYLLFPRLRNFRTSNTHTHIQSKIAAKCTTYPLDLRDFSIIHRIYQPKIKKFSNHEILNRWKTIHRRLSVYDKWSVRSDKVGCKEQCVFPDIFHLCVPAYRYRSTTIETQEIERHDTLLSPTTFRGYQYTKNNVHTRGYVVREYVYIGRGEYKRIALRWSNAHRFRIAENAHEIA